MSGHHARRHSVASSQLLGEDLNSQGSVEKRRGSADCRAARSNSIYHALTRYVILRPSEPSRKGLTLGTHQQGCDIAYFLIECIFTLNTIGVSCLAFQICWQIKYFPQCVTRSIYTNKNSRDYFNLFS